MQKTVEQIGEILQNGGIGIHPTDTVWSLSALANQPKAIEKIRELKQREAQKPFLLLVKDLEMLKNYVKEIPEIAFFWIKKNQEPLTIVYPNIWETAHNLCAEDGSLALRICKNTFCQNLMDLVKTALVSTSVNVSGQTPILTKENLPEFFLQHIDFLITENLEPATAKASKILKIHQDGQITWIRN